MGSYSSALTGESGNPGWYCFDRESIAGFNQYLSSKYNSTELAEKFNITDISSFNFTQYLRDKGYRSISLSIYEPGRSHSIDRVRWENLPQDIPQPDNYTRYLWREFENYQLKVLIDFYRELSSELKAYARSKGRNFWIAANLAPTLSYNGAEGRLSMIPLLTGIDFPFFEIWYDDIQYPERNIAPLFRTIYAAGKHFAAMTCPTPSFSSIFRSDNPYPEEQVLATAELMACGGWPQTTLHNLTYIRFMQQHPTLLPREQDGAIALIYSLPSAQNFRRVGNREPWGYRPFESIFYLLSDMNNVTFDVVIFGDDEFYPYTPTVEELSKYRALILSNATCLSDDQVNVLLNYVEGGGVLIGIGVIGIYDERGFPVTDVDRLNFASYFNATGGPDDPESIHIYDYGEGKIISLSQEVIDDFIYGHERLVEFSSVWHDPSYSEEEKAAEWWFNYEWYIGDWIDWFRTALREANVQTDISADLNPLVMFIRYWDPNTNATIFHFINYLYDNEWNDTAIDQENANFTFTLRPELQGKPLRVRYYTPEIPDGITLNYTIESGNMVKVVIPKLHIWGILRVEEAKEEPSIYLIDSPTELTGNIILDGDMIVASDLVIRDSIIKVSSNSNAPIEIEVLNGSSLRLINATFEPYDEGSSYYIVVHRGASLYMENSTIRGAGVSGPLDSGGVWVEAENTIIINSIFEDCYQYGLFLMEANYTYIRNCTFTGNMEGLMAYWTWYIKVINCTFAENSIGLYAKHTHRLEILNCRFEGNTRFGAMVDRSEFAVLRDSEFAGSEWDGLSFWTSIFVETVNCTSWNNGYGYTFRNTPISTILNSDAYNNTWSGILLRDVNSWNLMPPPTLLGYETENTSRGDQLPSNVIGGWDGRRTLITHNRIWGNHEGISVSCSGYFNEDIFIINNTIQVNDVGIDVNDTSSSIVAGNNFIDNAIQIRASNVDIDFNATGYGNYWSDNPGTDVYEVCDGLYDKHPLTQPNTIVDASDVTPPAVSILQERWIDGWDEDGINDFLELIIRLQDDSSLYTNPQYEIGTVNLIYPAMAELEEGGSPICSYALFPPETYNQSNDIIIDFTTDYFAYWVPDYLSPETLHQAHADVYASDIYGHWSRNETEPPHITMVRYENGSLHVEVAVFDLSRIMNVTLHYSTDGQNYQDTSMTYNDEKGTYETRIQTAEPGIIWFYVSATDIYGNYAETPIYTARVRGMPMENQVTIHIHPGWNLIGISLKPNDTSIEAIFGENLRNIQYIYGYYNGSWSYWIRGIQSKLSELKPGYGYWVKATENFNITLIGSIPEELNITDGWNLIALCGNETMPIDEWISEYPGWKDVFTYTTIEERWLYYIRGIGGNLETIEPGRGYWLYIEK